MARFLLREDDDEDFDSSTPSLGSAAADLARAIQAFVSAAKSNSAFNPSDYPGLDVTELAENVDALNLIASDDDSTDGGDDSPIESRESFRGRVRLVRRAPDCLAVE